MVRGLIISIVSQCLYYDQAMVCCIKQLKIHRCLGRAIPTKLTILVFNPSVIPILSCTTLSIFVSIGYLGEDAYRGTFFNSAGKLLFRFRLPIPDFYVYFV